jgi:hypothetical protein
MEPRFCHPMGQDLPSRHPLHNRQITASLSELEDQRPSPSRRRVKPGSATEEELVQKYLPLVKNVVGRLAMALPLSRVR